jgi:hypothetical protein
VVEEVTSNAHFRLRRANAPAGGDVLPTTEDATSFLKDDEAGKASSGFRIDHQARDLQLCDYILNTSAFRNADIVSDMLGGSVEPADVDLETAIERGLQVWDSEPSRPAPAPRPTAGQKNRPCQVVREPGAGEQEGPGPAEGEDVRFVSTPEGSDVDATEERPV